LPIGVDLEITGSAEAKPLIWAELLPDQSRSPRRLVFVEFYFANYLAELFAHYLAYRCHSMSDRPQGLRAPLRPFDQLFCHILVVDNEANVRQAARAVLTSLNFKVITAENGVEALVQVAEKRTERRAIITEQAPASRWGGVWAEPV
jgi:hypothetical protein